MPARAGQPSTFAHLGIGPSRRDWRNWSVPPANRLASRANAPIPADRHLHHQRCRRSEPPPDQADRRIRHAPVAMPSVALASSWRKPMAARQTRRRMLVARPSRFPGNVHKLRPRICGFGAIRGQRPESPWVSRTPRRTVFHQTLGSPLMRSDSAGKNLRGWRCCRDFSGHAD